MLMSKWMDIDFVGLGYTNIGGVSVSYKVVLRKQFCQDVQLEHDAKTIAYMILKNVPSFVCFLLFFFYSKLL
jgi:hypothetical protein